MANNFIKVSKKGVSAQLDVLFYKEGDFEFAYAPALDLVGYGRSQDDAKASFEIVFQNYLMSGIQRGTLSADLKKHGWAKNEVREQFVSPSPERVLSASNKTVKKIFGLPSFIKTTQSFCAAC